MKKIGLMLAMVLAISVTTSGCMKPPKIEKNVEIGTNETAFLVPLEGASKSNQKQFMSLEYLEKAKVATKRITLPQRAKKIGRFGHEIEWIPTMRVIKVDRTPITREWTKDDNTGTSKTNQAVWVESKDSIGFCVGVNITALIEEDNAAEFLYYYAGKSLSKIIDSNIRGKVTSILSREFGGRDLQQCKTDKKEISEIAFTEVETEFNQRGITIANLGLVGGLEYEDQEIQDAINAAYTAEMNIKTQEQKNLAQQHINTKILSIAVTARQEAEEFAKAQAAQVAKMGLEIKRIEAEALLKAAEKWNGQTPEKILPQGSNFLFGLDR